MRERHLLLEDIALRGRPALAAIVDRPVGGRPAARIEDALPANNVLFAEVAPINHFAAQIVRQRLREERAYFGAKRQRSEEHTSELQSLMRISYAVFCLKKKNIH